MVESLDWGQRLGRPRLRPSGAIQIEGLALPYSEYASQAARQTFLRELQPPPPEIAGDMLTLRDHYARLNDRRAERMRTLFPVEIRDEVIGGVRTHVVSPLEPNASNAGRALICLHGGAFTWGSGSGALVEAIPIAARMGVDVVAVDYRLGPEHRFPAASEDVAAVYRALIERRAPEAVGVYGCSAGAILTAQAIAWIASQGMPRPGAITMLSGAAGDLLGDSTYLSPLLEGLESHAGEPLRLGSLTYFGGAMPEDPLVQPSSDPEVLRRFPPTLLIAGGRDLALSSVANLHLELDRLGVETRLFVFDGLWHAFHIFPDLPESQHVYDIMGAFFERHLAA